MSNILKKRLEEKSKEFAYAKLQMQLAELIEGFGVTMQDHNNEDEFCHHLYWQVREKAISTLEGGYCLTSYNLTLIQEDCDELVRQEDITEKEAKTFLRKLKTLNTKLSNIYK